MDKDKDLFPFEKELAALLNKYGKDNSANTPDYVLAKMLNGYLSVYIYGVEARDKFFEFKPFEDKNIIPRH